MGKPTGFMEYDRCDPPKRAVDERVKDFDEIEQLLDEAGLTNQAARCMDCGIPFCHNYGCPVQNLIPEWNDMVYRGKWREALDLLHSTNNLPEITGRICPAPCEPACTLSINKPAVTIRQIELQIVEKGWREGWIQPQPPATKSGHRVAVVGSGPAGLAAAQQLCRMGHGVVVYEKTDRIGGILRYGIPDYKLPKYVLDRRIGQMEAEGVVFEPQVLVGEDLSINYLLRSFDAVVLAGGAIVPRDLPVPGRDLPGIHFAMDFLTQQNRIVAGDKIPKRECISAKGKHVVVIGGGDTGSDCVGTSIRQGAKSVRQLEILPKPPDEIDPSTPWPMWPKVLRTSTSHQEGCDREWSVMTTDFVGDKKSGVEALNAVDVDWEKKDGRFVPVKKAGTERTVEAQLVLLAMGFTREGNAGILNAFGVETGDDCAPCLNKDYMTNVDGVFVAGDLSQGASLVVRAIADGRRAADGVDRYLASQG